ncbi:hypothetical protein GCM10009758_33230 [Microbacterium hatanonis]|jgi:hypothetical protein
MHQGGGEALTGRWARSSATRPIEIPHLPPLAPRQPRTGAEGGGAASPQTGDVRGTRRIEGAA